MGIVPQKEENTIFLGERISKGIGICLEVGVCTIRAQDGDGTLKSLYLMENSCKDEYAGILSFEDLSCLILPSTNRHKFSDLYHFVPLCLGSFIVSIKLVKGSSVPATLNDVCGFLDMWGLNCPVFSNKTIFKKRLLYNCPNSDILISLDRLDLPLCCVALD